MTKSWVWTRGFAGFLVGLFAWSIQSAWAVPACPAGVEVQQPDGTRFRMQLRGDEYFSWNETDDGYAVVKDRADGFWKFANSAVGRAGFDAVREARVGSSDPARLDLRKNALPDAKALRIRLFEQQRKRAGTPVEQPVPGHSSGVSTASADEETAPVPPPQGIPVAGTKTIRNIVILACFSNHWDSGAGTVASSQGVVAVSAYSNLFNQVGYTTDGAVGSVRDYYKEVSYGKLTIQSVVTPWVRLPQNEDYYGANSSGNDVNPEQMVADAINAAAAAGFNFSAGDSDGDGWADCLTVIHSGHAEEYSGNPSTCIWSHQGSMASTVTKNSVQMYRYHTEPALRGWMPDTTYGITRIGVICHEMGHFFGLPDLYDYSGTTDGLGDWSLMAGGSWNGTYGTSPAHFDGWSKCFLGFVNPEQVHSQAGLSLARAEDSSVVKMLRDGTFSNEYFLVENRAKTGFDNSSQIYPGLLIYHVYGASENNDLGTWTHPVVKLEEADGDNSLGSNTASSEAGDAWTSTSGLSGGFRDQTGVQSANAMLYQSGAYNRTDSSAYYTYNTLSNFSAAASVMTCNLRSLKTAVSSQTVSVASYTVSWPACAQTTQYQIQEGVKTNLTSFSDGAEDENATYENWYLAGTVKRDSRGFSSGSYSYAMHQYYDSKWGSSVQSLTMRKPFKVGSGTVISFNLMSHLSAGKGDLKCQVSTDSGNTWKTLGSYNGYIDPWSSRSYNYAALNAAGVSSGSSCLLRFVANFEYGQGWSAFPGYGFAVDSISITGTEIAGYGGWTTLSSTVPTASYGVSGKRSGVYAYRVQAYAGGTWRGYGPEGEVAVNLPDISVTPTNQAAGSAGGAFSISVAPTNTSWTAATTASWISLTGATSGSGNGAVPYSVAQNNTLTSRTATVIIFGSGVTQACAVAQSVISLSEALDATNVVWSSGGGSTWFGQAATNYDGSDAVQSGAIANSQTSWLQTAVTGPGKLRFWWKVGGEDAAGDNKDYVCFLIDGVEQRRIDGQTGWLGVTNTLGTGVHTLRWEYRKDGSVSVAPDCGWVDQFVWVRQTSRGTPCLWLDQYGLVSGGDYEAADTADTDVDGYAAWQEYVAGTVPTNRDSVFLAYLTVTNNARRISWSPDMGSARTYVIDGKTFLTNAAWVSPTNAATRFFRVKVSLP